MLKLTNVTKKMAIIELTGGASLRITRSRKDGSTVGISGFVSGFKTLEVEELMLALMYVTKTDEELQAMGVTDLPVARRPKRKRKKPGDEEDFEF